MNGGAACCDALSPRPIIMTRSIFMSKLLLTPSLLVMQSTNFIVSDYTFFWYIKATMDWLEEHGGTLVVVGIIIFFGWLFLSSTNSSSSSTNEYNAGYESTVEDESNLKEPEEFHGYECSDDCSGHEAGYEWGDENGICSEYGSGDEYTGSYSDSFNEGVTAYIDDNCY